MTVGSATYINDEDTDTYYQGWSISDNYSMLDIEIELDDTYRIGQITALRSLDGNSISKTEAWMYVYYDNDWHQVDYEAPGEVNAPGTEHTATGDWSGVSKIRWKGQVNTASGQSSEVRLYQLYVYPID